MGEVLKRSSNEGGSAELLKPLRISERYEMFFREYRTRFSKLSSAVIGSIFRFLGLIAGKFPDLISTESRETQWRLYIGQLKINFSDAKKPDRIIMNDALIGLSDSLQCDRDRFMADRERVDDLFQMVLKLMYPVDNLKQYEITRSTLRLIDQHAEIFRPFLLTNYKTVFENLLIDVNHVNGDLQRMGRRALESILKVLASVLLENSASLEARDCFWASKSYLTICCHINVLFL
jgi:hypothetical protein